MHSVRTIAMCAVLGLSISAVDGGASAAGNEPDAPQLLHNARLARAVWKDFPGCRAKLSLNINGQRGDGTLTVKPSGDVELSGFPAGLDLAPAKAYLESLVNHRMADTAADQEKVEFVPESQNHPLGPLIKFIGDEKLHSTYRVHGDVVTEVNRVMGDTRFSIAVLDVFRNAAGKYTPRVFTVSFWDNATGAAKRSETHVNDWTTVGNFELPLSVTLLKPSASGNYVMEMTFRDHALLTSSGAGS